MPTESTPKPKRTRAEINRENAKKSTGPKTPEGKAASSKNAGDEAALLSKPKTQSGFVPQNPESAKPDFAKLFAEAQANLGLSQSELIDLPKTAA